MASNGGPRGFRGGEQVAGPPPVAGAVDLGAIKLTLEDRAVGQFYAEMKAGMRCGGCGRRIGVGGFRFTAFRTEVVEGQPTVVAMVKSACARDDCNHADSLKGSADVVEMCEFVWLDEAGEDAPVPDRVVKRHAERVEAARKAAGDAPETSEGSAHATSD
jgi:hypothetical protein